MNLRIGSRGSRLALWQAHWVQDQLALAGHSAEIRVIHTTGDKLTDASLAQSGTKGLFIKEIEEALLEGDVDLAVHSLKDLPTEQPAGLVIAAVPERADPRDAFISRDGTAFAKLPPGARLGTSSLRRQSQLRWLRPEIQVVPLRGNIDTRLKKLERGDCEGVVLAAAGVLRLGMESRLTHYFSCEEICPAVGQGALAIELREGDASTHDVLAPLDHLPTHRAVRAERAALRALGGGCQLPIAAHAMLEGEQMALLAVVASPDGKQLLRSSAGGSAREPEALGNAVARDLERQGVQALLSAL
jgi:hydroxymethylbilane synthase